MLEPFPCKRYGCWGASCCSAARQYGPSKMFAATCRDSHQSVLRRLPARTPFVLLSRTAMQPWRTMPPPSCYSCALVGAWCCARGGAWGCEVGARAAMVTHRSHFGSSYMSGCCSFAGLLPCSALSRTPGRTTSSRASVFKHRDARQDDTAVSRALHT